MTAKEAATKGSSTGNAKKKSSIKRKIQSSMLMIVMISLILVGGLSIGINYWSTNSTLEQTMKEAVKLASSRIEWQLTAYTNIVVEAGSTEFLASDSISVADKQELISQKAAAYQMQRGNIIGSDGLSIFDGKDYNDRAYFKAAMEGKTYITEPLVSKITGELTIIISAPLWKDGIPNGTPIGAIYMVPKESFLNDIMADIQISKNSGAYVIDSSGITIAHTNPELVYSGSNTIEEAKTDKKLAKLASLEQKMMNGESGFSGYSYGGVNKFLAYTPIANTNGWSIGINAYTTDFMTGTIMGTIILAVVLLVAILFTIWYSSYLSNGIGNPIKACAERIVLLSQGDLESPSTVFKTGDETELLSEATSTMISNMKRIIDDVNYLLTQMSNGNFNVTSKAHDAYIGSYSALIEAMRKINYELSNTLKQIKDSAEHVSAGAEQLADGAVQLSEGATEQAGAVEELMATIADVTEQVTNNSNEAARTSKDARQIGTKATESNQQMQRMADAMAQIDHASREIANIIASIEEIASQTNLLSLNASIEAARAGEAGRGFAVVASEIGQLATQSALAANNTRVLIEKALQEVSNGDSIMEQTTHSLSEVIEEIEAVIQSITSVADSSVHQAESIQQINMGVEQIAHVIQSNSAMAEESSATSEELSAQATNLNELTSKFQIRVF